MALKGLAKLVKESQKKPSTPAQSFLDSLDSVVIQENKPRKPKANYKPSMMGSCLRQMYFCKTGQDIDGGNVSPDLVGMGESGSGRHDDIQKYVMKMKKYGSEWEWVDIEEYIKKFKPHGTVFEMKIGNEAKLRNDVLGLSFMCDGILYNSTLDMYFILEIKTQVSRKQQGQTEIWTKHIVQAACYSAAMGIDNVIFVYENRDFCSKIAYDICITDEMREVLVLDKIEACNDYIAEGVVPPKTTDVRDCKYCNYVKSCKRWGDS